MADIRAGRIDQSRESVHRVTRRALAILHDIERAHRGDHPDDMARTGELIANARSEIQGAAFHDLAESGEEAG